MILANEDALARDILRRAFADRGLDVVAEPVTLDALAIAMRDFPAAVIVADTTLESMAVDDAVHMMDGEQPVVVVSRDISAARVTRSLSDSVRGYLLHDAAPEEVVAGVVAVARGGLALNPTAAAIVFDHYRQVVDTTAARWRGRPLFTPREAEVLDALAEGLSTKAIARQLGMAPKTVENHKIRIFDKLGVRSQAQAVVAAVRYRLVSSRGNGNGNGHHDDAT